jgi:5-carboxymethyl-2-hydroxymuconate isomerase
MPHAIIEYSQSLSECFHARHILHVVHGVMQTSGLFAIPAIKTRAYEAKDFLVGEHGTAGTFLHVTIYLMNGRTLIQKQQLSKSMFDALNERLEDVHSLTVDIRELDRDTYSKK